MTTRARVWMLWIASLGLAVILVSCIAQLPGFGEYPGPYGDMINTLAPYERQVTNAVAAVNFDYRGLDSLGEEFILFAAVSGIALLLRGERGESPEAEPEMPWEVQPPSRSDALRWMSLGLIGFINLFGWYMVVHGHLTPGGGFQGGAILGTTSMLVYVGIGYRTYCKSTPKKLIELIEAFAAGAYVLIGGGGILAGGAFLQNVLPLGIREHLFSGGTIPLLNFAVGIEVAAGFTVLFAEFLEETRINEKSKENQ